MYVTEERDSSETDKLSNLPLELSETVLTRTFVMLYLSNFEGSKSSSAKHQAFDLQSLASVCWYWRNTLTDLVRGQLKRLIKRECTSTWAHVFASMLMYAVHLQSRGHTVLLLPVL